MKAKYIIISVVIILLALGIYWSINFIPSKLAEWGGSSTEPPEPMEEEEVEELMSHEPEESEEEISEQFPQDMSENQVMDAIHHMTHQKVKSKDGKKWGALQVTPDRVERLIEIVEANDYQHEDFYLETLKEWEAGNFENAVTVHNYIWNVKNGTIGEAERLLTPEEEAWYIKQNFK